MAGSGEPGRIVVAGDWHGNIPWAEASIAGASARLAGEDSRIIVHLGDFGWWPGIAGEGYLRYVSAACAEHDVRLYALRGNHDDPAVAMRYARDMPSACDAHPGIRWLADSLRWNWHNRTWIAAGGAVSPDRIYRIPEVSWWAGEELNEGHVRYMLAGGTADVLVSHDVGFRVNDSLQLGPWPRGWPEVDHMRSSAHQERMQRLADGLRISHWFHGHMHKRLESVHEWGYGPVQVHSMDMDGTNGNWGVLDIRAMKWES